MEQDTQALITQLVREMGERLLAVARRVTGDVPSAEDAVQEAYLELHRALLRRPEEIRNPRGWLRRVVVQKAVAAVRRNSGDTIHNS